MLQDKQDDTYFEIMNAEKLFNDVTNRTATNEIKNIVGHREFMYAKPVGLISKLIALHPNDNAVVLDFFAGSGTTGQAVLDLNKKDGGTRRFILCTNNDKTSNPNGIAYDVTTKRLKRVMTGSCYDGTNTFKWLEKNKPYGDSLDVYEIGEVSNRNVAPGESAFDVIDEANYGLEAFENTGDKIAWVCHNFENTQRYLEHNEEATNAESSYRFTK